MVQSGSHIKVIGSGRVKITGTKIMTAMAVMTSPFQSLNGAAGRPWSGRP